MALLYLPENTIDLRLYEPVRVDESAHFNKRACGLYYRKQLTMGFGSFLPTRNVSKHDASSDYVYWFPTSFFNSPNR